MIARRAWRRRGARIAGILGVALIAAVLGPSGTAASVQPRSGSAGSAQRVVSVKDSPGYVPLVDPESTAVLLGRRLNAPSVSRGFEGGTRGLEDLGRAVCRAIRSRDPDSLLLLCVREDEFHEILWPEFPQSRPATGLQWEDGWRVLYARLLNGCSGAIRDHGGRRYEFVRFEADSVARYRNFRLHGRLALVVRDEAGQTQRLRWLRGVAERRGRFKIYSTDD